MVNNCFLQKSIEISSPFWAMQNRKEASPALPSYKLGRHIAKTTIDVLTSTFPLILSWCIATLEICGHVEPPAVERVHEATGETESQSWDVAERRVEGKSLMIRRMDGREDEGDWVKKTCTCFIKYTCATRPPQSEAGVWVRSYTIRCGIWD